MKNITYKLAIAISLILALSACEKHENTDNTIKSEDSVYLFVNDLMHYWYFWNDDIPELDYMSYNDPEKLLEDFKVPQDKWSFIDKAQTITTYFESGENFGFGFYLGWDSQYNLRVIFSYNYTAAYEAGIYRGTIIYEIDDVPVKDINSFDSFFSSDAGSMKFKFLNSSHQVQTVTLSKELYNQNAVFESKVFDVSGTRTGYISYQSFLEYSEFELLDAFSFLKSENIKELIVDLRYNGGGLISLAQEMADMLVPSGSENEIFFSIMHNNIVKEEYDESINFNSNALNLDLSRVFFITNEHSASASELVINGLEPHMDVLHIGTATAGKPYGMYGFEFQDWLAFPVTAKSVNANGYGDYENGIVPDKIVVDDHRYDWGDLNDPAIVQAINYIQYGNFDVIAMALKGTNQPSVIKGANKLDSYLMIMDK